MALVHTGAKRVQLLVRSRGVGAPWEEKSKEIQGSTLSSLKWYVLQNDPVAMLGITLHIHVSGTSFFFFFLSKLESRTLGIFKLDRE